MKANIKTNNLDILDLFHELATQHRFAVIEKEANFATAVHKQNQSIGTLLKKCFGGSTGQQSLSAVRLQIMVDDASQMKKVFLKSLYGDQEKLEPIIEDFKQEFVERFKEGEVITSSQKDQSSSHHQVLGQDNELTMRSFEEDTEVSVEGSNFEETAGSSSLQTKRKRPREVVPLFHPTTGYHQETQAYYHYHKILSSDNYALGQKVDEYIQSFFLQYKSVIESAELLPQPMESIMEFISEIVQDLAFSHKQQSQQTQEKKT